MTYNGHPIDLKPQTRLGIMAATLMAGAEDYSAESAVLAAVRLDKEVATHLKREEEARQKAWAKNLYDKYLSYGSF